jgi:hypothetical protein
VNKPKLLLLDTDVIVFAHQFGIWDNLKKAYEVHVPATVIDTEAQFFDSKDGRKKIDLNAEEAAGKIKRLEATALDVAETFKNFEPTYLAALHDGEKEGITILRAEAESGMVFCTGDMIAIESVGMLGLSSSCLSFEEVLQMAGLLKLVTRFMSSLTKKAHDTHLEKGKTRRTTGECFKKSPLSL